MSALLLLEDASLCTAEGGLQQGWVLIRDERIQQVGTGMAPDVDAQRLPLEGKILTPGLIDLHVHGAMGCDTMDASAESLREMSRFFAHHGVTGYLPTTVAAPARQISAALATVAEAMRERPDGAGILGAHLESPYIAKERAGAQDTAQVRKPQPAEYEAFLASGVVRILTLAPEVPGCEALIQAACKANIVVSAGHTRATFEDMERAVALGLSHVTHLFNGMEPLHHREPGAVGAALTMEALSCELIADNIHIHPAVLRLAIQAKGVGNIALITDAMRGTGMPDGDYELGSQRVMVRGGVARLPGGALAGSTLTLDRAVQQAMTAAGLPFCKAITMATATPARVLGLRNKGAIASGMDADLTVWDESLRVVLTLVSGRIVYDAG